MNGFLAAGIAFFALGANVLGAIVLLLLNPRSRGVRWYVAFQAAIVTWLLAQGMALGTGDWSAWIGVHRLGVSLLPILFACFAFAESVARSDRQVAGLLAAGLVALAVLWNLPSELTTARSVGFWAWHLGGWGTGAALLMRHNRVVFVAGEAAGRHGNWVSVLLLLFVPVIFVAAVTVGNPFFIYGMPLLTVAILVLQFVGVVQHRYYDIEVRAARTGELAARAAEQERLAVLGELAASVAHEVRNPLTGLQSLAQRLAEDDVDEERRRRYASVMIQEARRLDRIVTNLLGIARHRPAADEAAGGETALDDLFEDLRLLLVGRAKRTGVELELDGRGVRAPAAREPLAQVLLNLVLNAIAHSPRGGRVRLTAGPVAAAGIQIVVQDEGPGIPEQDRNRIFEPFQATGAGTGLGLAVVRRICGERSWTVHVGASPDGGAEFRVEIPEAES